MRTPQEAQLEILAAATKAIRDRGQTYGPPERHFERTAGAIRALLGIDMTPERWAMCMTIDKLARAQHSYHEDNIVDAVGYLACMARVRQASIISTTGGSDEQ